MLLIDVGSSRQPAEANLAALGRGLYGGEGRQWSTGTIVGLNIQGWKGCIGLGMGWAGKRVGGVTRWAVRGQGREGDHAKNEMSFPVAVHSVLFIGNTA